MEISRCTGTPRPSKASRKETNQEMNEGARGEATARSEICQLVSNSGGEKVNWQAGAVDIGICRGAQRVKSGKPTGSGATTSFLVEKHPADLAQSQKQCWTGGGVWSDSPLFASQHIDDSAPVSNSE